MRKSKRDHTSRVDVSQDRCGEAGYYAPKDIDKNGKETIILDETRWFNLGEEFPDERFWAPVKE